MPPDKYKDRGLTGLVNLGNTCFMNTCIQMLSNTYELNDFLENDKFKKNLKKNVDSKLLLEWNDLRKLMWSQNCTIEPRKFLQTVHQVATVKKRDMFTGYAQNDVNEFLIFIVDCFHNALHRPVVMSINGNPTTSVDELAIKVYDMIKRNYTKEYSEIWNIFYGVSVTELKSTTDTSLVHSKNPESFFTISLPMPLDNNTPSLYDCFDLHVSGELLHGENAWFNEKTKRKEDVIKKIYYWSFPTVLCIDLKRFDVTNRKRQNLVSFPIDDLDLRKYVHGYNKNSFVYELYGVCNHMGGPAGGHYTGFVKNPNGKWYHFNDQTVSIVSNPNEIVSPRAYCLFYRKKNSV